MLIFFVLLAKFCFFYLSGVSTKLQNVCFDTVYFASILLSHNLCRFTGERVVGINTFEKQQLLFHLILIINSSSCVYRTSYLLGPQHIGNWQQSPFFIRACKGRLCQPETRIAKFAVV